MLLHVATTYKSTENQTSQAQSQDLKAGGHLYVLFYESLTNLFGYVLRGRVILVLGKVA